MSTQPRNPIKQKYTKTSRLPTKYQQKTFGSNSEHTFTYYYRIEYVIACNYVRKLLIHVWAEESWTL